VHFDQCGANHGYVRIDHLDGYSTTYYHLTGIPGSLTEGLFVAAGQYLGNVDISTACGGDVCHQCDCVHTNCSHVHFSVWYTPPGTQFVWVSQQQGVDLNNIQLGDWIVYRGGAIYVGCMWPILGGTQQCNGTGQIFNSGRIGGSAPSETANTSVASIHGSDGAGWYAYVGLNSWSSIGGGVVGNPAEIVFNNQLNVFVRGTDGIIYQNLQTQTGWTGWNPFGIQATSDPVVTTFNNQLQLLVRGTDFAVWQRFEYWSGSSYLWSGWTSLGGQLYGTPAAASLGGLFQIVVRGYDNALWQRSYNGARSAWGSLGGILTSDPNPTLTVVNGALNVLLRGNDGTVYQNYEYQSGGGYAWSGWQPLYGSMVGTPNTAVAGGQFFVVVHWVDGTTWQRVWNSSTGWGAWASLGGPTITSDAVLAVPGNVQLLVRGLDGTTWLNTNVGTSWSGWSSIGGSLA